MNISKTELAIMLILTVLSTLMLNYGVEMLVPLYHRSPTVKVNLFVIGERFSGSFETAYGNVATDIGERYARNILGFNNVTAHNATKYISLGNATIDQTLTKLTQEVTTVGGERAEGTATAHNFGGDYTVNFTKKFEFTGDVYFNATGLHWNPTGDSDNNMYCCVAITGYSWHNLENCTIIWSTTYDFN